MSLILEALKKSEDKRRLGAAPDLATPFSAPRRRSWVWPLAALIVVAGVVAWALRPSPPPPSAPAAAVPPKTKAPVAQAAPTAGQKTGAPLRSVTGNNDLVQAAPPDNLPKAEAHPAERSPSGQFVFGQPSAERAGRNGRRKPPPRAWRARRRVNVVRDKPTRNAPTAAADGDLRSSAAIGAESERRRSGARRAAPKASAPTSRRTVAACRSAVAPKATAVARRLPRAPASRPAPVFATGRRRRRQPAHRRARRKRQPPSD